MKWDNSYNINFKKLALLLLPTAFRKNILRELTKLLVSPVNFVHVHFMAYRRECDFRLTHNGQRCYLRGCLNEIYDPIKRRIQIGEAEDVEMKGIYKRNDPEKRIVLINNSYPFIIGMRGFTGSEFDFTVRVPKDILDRSGEKARIKATVQEYKLASKQFTIISL